MCIVAWITNFNKYKLILICNREESYSRPTTTAYLWPDKHLVASQDLIHHGSQLAIDLNGRISVLTNLIIETNTLTQGANLKSRGLLTVNYLSTDQGPEEYTDSINDTDYMPYNLLIGGLSGYTAFLHPDCDQESKDDKYNMSYSKYNSVSFSPLDSSTVYVLENKGLYDDTPRTIVMKSLFTSIINVASGTFSPGGSSSTRFPAMPETDVNVGEKKEELIDKLFELLNDENVYRSSPNYGTRTQTVILIDQDDQVTFIEKSLLLPSLKLMESPASRKSAHELPEPKVPVPLVPKEASLKIITDQIANNKGTWIKTKFEYSIIKID